MIVRVVSDLHLESGILLGVPDPTYGNSRLCDQEQALMTAVCARFPGEYDVLVFAGDLAETSRPGPAAYSIARHAFQVAGHDGRPIIAITGNHDHLAAAPGHTALRNVLPDRAVYADRPMLHKLDGLQIGVLPWTPPGRLFEQPGGGRPAGLDRRALHRLAAEQLENIARGLASKLDPDAPSMLALHWTLDHDEIPDVMRDAEVILDPQALEAAGFDVVVAGHWHKHRQVGERSWIIGPPLRGSFGEADLQPGYLEIEFLPRGAARGTSASTRVRHVEIPDRELVTLDMRHLHEWRAGVADLADVLNLIDENTYRAAIVKLRAEACDDEMSAWLASGPLRDAVDCLLHDQGVLKVVGPELTVVRSEREERSTLSVTVDPIEALGEYVERHAIEPRVRSQVLAEAAEIVR